MEKAGNSLASPDLSKAQILRRFVSELFFALFTLLWNVLPLSKPFASKKVLILLNNILLLLSRISKNAISQLRSSTRFSARVHIYDNGTKVSAYRLLDT